MYRRVTSLMGTLFITTAIVSSAAAQPPVRLSMAKTFFHDQPKLFVDIAIGEFKQVMKQSTELDGELTVDLGAAEIAEKLNAKQVDFGILYAHEFAWAQKKYPDLQPLLIAATKKLDKRAHLIVRQDNPAKTFADLRGKKFDLPLRTKEYCQIFVEKLANDKRGPAGFFGSIAKSSSQPDALDQVAHNEADATVVDTIWLDFYKEVKGPVFAKNLRVLQESGIVPPAVIVYKKGALAQKTVDQIGNGLRQAHTTARGLYADGAMAHRCVRGGSQRLQQEPGAGAEGVSGAGCAVKAFGYNTVVDLS